MPTLRERLVDPVFLTRMFLFGGLFFRLWHYVANHVIWYDEAVLLANVLDKSWLELLGPLQSEVAAPPLYLWTLKLIHTICGDVDYLWRLFPLVAGVSGLLLSVPVFRAMLTPHGAALAVGLLAVADDHIRLSNTVKPYTLDALGTLVLLFAFVKTRRWPTYRRLLLIAALAPVLLGFSYPMAFVLGGVLLGLLPRDRAAVLAWLLAVAVVGGTFAVLYFGPIKAQRVSKLENEWERNYLPYKQPAEVPWWLTWHTFGACQQSCNPSGALLTVFVPLGALAFWRTGHRRWLVVLGGAWLAVLAASALRSYPYGQNRLMQFLGPIILMLGVRGLELMATWKRSFTVGLGIALFVVADGYSLHRLVFPWVEPDARSVAKYLRENRNAEPLLSDEGNYFYFLNKQVQPLSAAAEVPIGGRVWVAMDHYTPEIRRHAINITLGPLGFVEMDAKEFTRAGAYLYERRSLR
jgi:hypothetical protein